MTHPSAEPSSVGHAPADGRLTSLPVPDLEVTLERLSTAIRAVADEPTQARSAEAIEHFRTQHGPMLQQHLLDFANERDALNSSWLADQWLRDYLTVRAPLPLSTNVGFQLRVPTPSPGLAGAVEFIAAAARLHLLQTAQQIPEERDARGTLIDSSQWRCFNGSLRIPGDPADEISYSELAGASRSIGVIARGRLWDVPITTADGELVDLARLHATLESILHTAHQDAHRADATQPSYLGSAVLAAYRRTFDTEPNAQICRALRDHLFSVTLLEPAPDSSEADLLRAVAFEPGHAWAYTPLTYQVAVTDTDFTAVHVEHSTIDGATLARAVSLIQRCVDTRPAPDPTQPLDHRELAWDFAAAPELKRRSPEPPTVRVHIERVGRIPTSELPFRFSADAMSQLILSIAQLLTYGRIRAVYEAVDMREYKAGRTECLRAVTPEAVAAARAIVDGADTATAHQAIRAAIAAHRDWVIACKTGAAMDRHLWALGFTAARHGAPMELLDDPGVRAARTDFLSTTSLGSDEAIIRYAFAPTTPGGFGVNYTPHPEHIEYCVTWLPEEAERPEEFCANLRAAGEFLSRVLRA